jgi:hypothetical protein
MSPKIIAGLIPALFAAYASTAHASTLTDVQVIDRATGEVLPKYQHHGRVYIVGTPGNRYSINVRNKSNGRIMSIVSVDGVNAISGQTADTLQQGYVLAPWNTAEIAGWRKNLKEVAAFYFTSLSNSYAGRTGRPENVGVIGVAVYEEDLPVVQPYEEEAQASFKERADSASGAPAAAPAAKADQANSTLGNSSASRSVAAESKKLGTGHGERLAAPTQYTSFKRLTMAPAEVVTIYYDSRANLLAQGVIPATVGRKPNPFPGNFVPDPEG